MTKKSGQESLEKKETSSNGRKKSGILAGQDIDSLQLVDPIGNDRHEKCLKAASCDLRLGSEIFICGQGKPKIQRLKEGDQITIESFGRIIFSTKEKIMLKKHDNIVGRFDLMVGFGLDGLILQVGTQVEPLYNGPLFGLLINTHGASKTLYEGQRFLTIEFSRTTKRPDKHLLKENEIKNLRDFLKRQTVNRDRLAMPSIIEKVRDDLEDCQLRHGLKRRIDDSRMFRKAAKYGFIAIVVSIVVSIVVLVFTHHEKIESFYNRVVQVIDFLGDKKGQDIERIENEIQLLNKTDK